MWTKVGLASALRKNQITCVFERANVFHFKYGDVLPNYITSLISQLYTGRQIIWKPHHLTIGLPRGEIFTIKSFILEKQEFDVALHKLQGLKLSGLSLKEVFRVVIFSCAKNWPQEVKRIRMPRRTESVELIWIRLHRNI